VLRVEFGPRYVASDHSDLYQRAKERLHNNWYYTEKLQNLDRSLLRIIVCIKPDGSGAMHINMTSNHITLQLDALRIRNILLLRSRVNMRL